MERVRVGRRVQRKRVYIGKSAIIFDCAFSYVIKLTFGVLSAERTGSEAPPSGFALSFLPSMP